MGRNRGIKMSQLTFLSWLKLCLSTHVPSFNPTSPPMHTHTHPHPHTSIPAMMVPIRYGMTKWFHKLMNQVSTSVAGSSKGQLMNTRGPEEEHLIAHPTTHKILPSLYTAVRRYVTVPYQVRHCWSETC